MTTGSSLNLGRMLSIALVVACAGSTAATATDDIIRLKNKNTISCTVTDETYEGVSYTSAGVEGRVRQCEVESIEWGDRSPDFIAAERARTNGEYEDAVAKYGRAMKARGARKFYVEPTCTYYVGLCNLQMGKLDKADEAFRKLLADHPKARFVPYAHIAIGDIQLSQGQWDKAIESYAVVGNAIDSTLGRPTFCDDLYYEAKVKMAEALVGKKEYDKAIKDLDALIREVERSNPDIALAGQRLKASALVLSGKTDDGLKIFRDIIDKSVKEMDGSVSAREIRLSTIVAQCYNGIGGALMAAGRPKEALLEYLRVVTVLGSTVGDEYPRSLIGAVQCFDALGQKDRAKELFAELKRDYANFPGVKALNVK
ncbi:MAG TPA: tetratricopeptide repeat protein [Planctomycetota bacterium]|nr:tetratricopeptide repeat protein [Planctomycetota bacterium]